MAELERMTGDINEGARRLDMVQLATSLSIEAVMDRSGLTNSNAIIRGIDYLHSNLMLSKIFSEMHPNSSNLKKSVVKMEKKMEAVTRGNFFWVKQELKNTIAILSSTDDSDDTRMLCDNLSETESQISTRGKPQLLPPAPWNNPIIQFAYNAKNKGRRWSDN
jgi:hypothetical protein